MAPDTDDVPMDYVRAVEEFGGDKGFFDEVLSEFIQVTFEKIAVINRGLLQNNTNCVQQAAHYIKGGAMNITAAPLAREALALENLAKSGTLENGQLFVDRLSARMIELQQYYIRTK